MKKSKKKHIKKPIRKKKSLCTDNGDGTVTCRDPRHIAALGKHLQELAAKTQAKQDKAIEEIREDLWELTQAVKASLIEKIKTNSIDLSVDMLHASASTVVTHAQSLFNLLRSYPTEYALIEDLKGTPDGQTTLLKECVEVVSRILLVYRAIKVKNVKRKV